MKLLIDQGNTRTKIALMEDNIIIDQIVSENLQEQDFFDFVANKQIHKAIFASVAKMSHFLDKYCNNYAVDIKSLVIKTNNQNKLQNLYGFYDNLGADLLASAIYANYLGKNLPTMTISMGSCITCVIVEADGKFVGASISPGIMMRANALHQYTNALPFVDINNEMHNTPLSSIRFANGTPQVILKGIITGVEGELLKNINDFKSLYPNGKIFITGGDADYFSSISKLTVVDNMVLMGLNLV